MKEKFEDILKSKLEQAEVTPPDGMWERLNRSMAEIRRDEAFGRAGEEVRQSAAPSIRRPRRQRFAWAYVAASLAAIGVIFMVSRNVGTMVGDGTQVAHGTVVEDSAAGNEQDLTGVDALFTDTLVSDASSGNDGDESAGTVVRRVVPVAGSSHGSNVMAANMPETNTISGDDNIAAKSVDPYATGMTDRIAVSDDVNNNAQDSSPVITDNSSEQPDVPARVLTQKEMAERRYADNRTKDSGERNKAESRSVSAGLFASNSPSGNSKSNEAVSPMLRLSSDAELAANGYTPYDLLNEVDRSVKLKHDYPISTGISVAIPVTDKISIQTGLIYTYMKSDAHERSEGKINYEVDQKLHYLGIPVSVKYDFLEAGRFVFYANAGGTVEKCISGKKTISTDNGSEKVSSDYTTRGKGLQTSVGANVGAEFKISNTFGIYVEPGVSYFFENSNQPESYRTEHPWNFTARAGIRINL